MIKKPLLVMFKGHAGVGKTTLSQNLNKILGWSLVVRDDIKEELLKQGMSLDKVGSESYLVLWKKLEDILRSGKSIICDTNVNQPVAIEHINGLIEKSGCQVVVIDCYCGDTEEHKKRLDSRKRENRSGFWIDSWEKYQAYLESSDNQGGYEIPYRTIKVDTCRDINLKQLVKQIIQD